MTRADILQESFNAGELDPGLHARSSLSRVQSAGAYVLNWLPAVQGPAEKRPGTIFLRALNNQGARGWLARFVFNNTDAVVMEFTPNRLRFFTAAGVLLSDDDSSLQVTTPWNASDLTSEDGTFALSLVQSGDVIYAAHRRYRTRKITRLSATSWSIAALNPQDGPFLDKNSTSTTIYASAASGSGVTLTASASIFSSAHVGSLIRLWAENLSSVKPWEPSRSVSTNDLRRSDGKVYRALNSAYTGGVRPTHREGTASDSSGQIIDPTDGVGLVDAGVDWQYRHSGYGVLEITDVASGTVATGTVRSRLPDAVVSSGNATPIWELCPWPGTDGFDGFPSNVAFFRNRLVLGRDRHLWLSRVKDFEKFADRTADQVLDDDAMTLTIGGDRVQRMKWLQPLGDRLIIGAEAGELALQSISTSQPFGPTNAQVLELSGYGSRKIKPELAHGRMIYAHRSGRQLLASRVTATALGDALETVDLSVLAEKIAEIGVVDFAWQATPANRLWCAGTNGQCFVMTWHPEQEVVGFTRVALGGGAVESVETLPDPNGAGDDVFFIVRRHVGGTLRRYVEVLHRPASGAEAFYVDCGHEEYRDPGLTEVSGLEHLAGETVQILADGARHPDQVVPPSGTITLERPAARVAVGLGYESLWKALPFDAGNPRGTSQNQRSRIVSAGVRVLDTGPLEISPDGVRWIETQRRSTATPYGQVQGSQSHWRTVRPFGGWSSQPSLFVRSSGPFAATLAGLALEFVVT